MKRILFIFLLLMLGMRCAPKPYQPNYNREVSHNRVVATRNSMVQKQADKEIRRMNLQRKKARKRMAAKHKSKKAEKNSKKLIR